MKKAFTLLLIVTGLAAAPHVTFAQDTAAPKAKKAKTSDPEGRATEFVAALNLTDTVKANRVKALIKTHLTAVLDWNNTHDYTLVPEA